MLTPLLIGLGFFFISFGAFSALSSLSFHSIRGFNIPLPWYASLPTPLSAASFVCGIVLLVAPEL